MTSAANEPAIEPNDRAIIGDNSKMADQPTESGEHRPARRMIPIDRVDIWQAVQTSATDLTSSDLEEEVELLGELGQRTPVLVRPIAGDRFEAIGQSRLVEVLRAYNERNPKHPLELHVNVASLSDDQAYRVAAQEVDGGPAFSQLAKGTVFANALKAYGTQKRAAAICGVSESAMSKALNVARAAHYVGKKVTIQRDISQRDAAWFMEIAGKSGRDPAIDPERRATLLKALEQAPIGSSAEVFKSLRAAFPDEAPKRPKAQRPIVHAGAPVGHLARNKKGVIAITLDAVANLEPDAIGKLVSLAVAEARREAQ